ncbi:MAG: DPP IV N-terminal domain-containing protein [Candidatus Aminicenantes bacterium]|nr:DPP IV N-terminal domain-containing protein [Candidatus Aminicenantes bacterium]
METGQRFWYSYETSQGRKFMAVDPVKKTRAPIFDNARMAAQLTQIVLTPYEAAHLPIRSLRYMDKETAVRFDLDVDRNSDVRLDGKIMKAWEVVKKVEDKKKAEKAAREAAQKKDEEEKNKNKDQKEEEKKNEEKAAPPAKPEPEPKTVKLYFRYEPASGKLEILPDFEAPKPRPRWASVSPDEKSVIFGREYDLYMMDAESFALAMKNPTDKAIKEIRLTTDGEKDFSYTRDLNDEQKKEFKKDEKDRKDFRVPAGFVVWSPDSRKFALVREDARKVADLWVINTLSNPRPTLETYKYAMPGEENQPQEELSVFDVVSKTKVVIKADRFKDQTISIETAPRKTVEVDRDYPPATTWLSPTSDILYFGRQSRDLHRYDVCRADTASGETTVVIEEILNTYVEVQPLRLVNGGKELLWWSERDGWGHYYLYEGSGKLIRQLTSGEYTTQGILGLDEKARVLYFQACGREPNEDPYFMHAYSVGLDGKAVKLLNPGDANHAARFNDAGQFFVDNFSRVDTAPKSQLRDALGNVVLDLETTDVSALLEAGFKFPEPFKVKADDGVTDLYGVMYKPFDFDPAEKYPIILYVYPGPQTESVSKTFSPRSGSMFLAQFGFIVVEVGNRGGHPQRSKWYHNYGYGNLRDYGLADKKRTVEQLAVKHDYIDIEKVGIFGHSGGGFMTAAALLVYPDFFKVGVSSSGNHENNIYNRWWSEKHHGVREVADKDGAIRFEYAIEKNSEVAGNLKGRLLLTTGDIDNNVHPGNTYRLINALIRANKRFDVFLFPGQRHGYGDMSDYWNWYRADYFCKWLLGDFSQTIDMWELNREKEQSGRKVAAAPPTGRR